MHLLRFCFGLVKIQRTITIVIIIIIMLEGERGRGGEGMVVSCEGACSPWHDARKSAAVARRVRGC
jgi:hypothetical protein